MNRIRLPHLVVAPLVCAVLASPASAASIPDATWPAFASLHRSEASLDPQRLERASTDALQAAVAENAAHNAVEVDVVDLRAVPDSIDAFALEGVGRVRLEQGDWIPVRFNAGYDGASAQVFGMRVQPLASYALPGIVAGEAGVHDRVAGQVAARVVSEFPDQPVDVVIMGLTPVAEQPAYLALRGTGTVDFAEEGIAPLAFSAILDRASGLVIATDYTIEVIGAHGEAAAASSIAAR